MILYTLSLDSLEFVEDDANLHCLDEFFGMFNNKLQLWTVSSKVVN